MRMQADKVLLHPVQLDVAEGQQVHVGRDGVGGEEGMQFGIGLAEEDAPFTGVAVDGRSKGLSHGWSISTPVYAA